MSHMQIDFPSPTPLRSVGHKRPRSPASPSPLDRPSKRVSLAPGSTGKTPSPLLGHVIQQEQQDLPNANLQLPPSVFCERRASPDDWVSKTSGLKIESPLFGIGHERTVPLPESGKWSRLNSSDVNEMTDAHEQMNTDADDLPHVVMDPWLFPSAVERHVAPQSSSNLPHMASTPFSSPLRLPDHTPRAPDQQSNIHIHVQPATPSNRGSHHSTMSQSSPMSISPSRSGNWSPSSSSVKKPRVTMGPRPDCEKCRLGVKGHWMHIE